MSPPRISLTGYLGTVRYTGPIEGTPGNWLGIEWDDPKRGKHDGVKDGKQYFTCRLPNSGSFIRPSPNISYGQSFLQALTSKYIETLHGSTTREQVVLGSSQGTIMVEAVNLDKIRGKLADLSRLREVSLDGLDVAICDNADTIQQTCPNIRGLDLSKNLFPDWDVVALIARQLPVLRRLCLNHNRLQPGTTSVMETAFLHLTELQLNGTMLSWQEMQNATAVMPNLEVIEMGYNSLARLCTGDELLPVNKSVRVINLDDNTCSDWIHIWESIRHYTSLQRLIMTSNCIDAIPFATPRQSFPTVKHLLLSHNKISAWCDVDALSSWCPGLESLTLSGNPLTSQAKVRHPRPWIIAKIPTLLILDGAEISQRERTDSEILYLSNIVQECVTEDKRIKAHPQWLNLCKSPGHGPPGDAVKVDPTQNKLSQRLIGLNLYRSLRLAADDYQQVLLQSQAIVLRVLPTMSLRALRMKTTKMLKIKTKIFFWKVQGQSNTLAELGINYDDQTIDWLGLDEGTIIIYHVVDST